MVAVVQSAASAIASGSTTATLGAAPTSGNLLLFLVGFSWNFSVTSAPAGSTLVAAGETTGAALSVYRRIVAGGDGTGWSVTVDGDVVGLVAIELSGVDTTTPIGNTPGFATVTGTALTAPTVTPASADIGGIVVSSLSTDDVKTATVPGGSTRIAIANTGSSFHSVDSARINADIANTSPITGVAWTWTGSTPGIATSIIVRPVPPVLEGPRNSDALPLMGKSYY